MTSSLIYINTRRSINLDQLCETTKKLEQQVGGIDLILVDNVQKNMGSDSRLAEPQSSLNRLKQLAIELNVPVVEIYQLDPTVVNHSATLTKSELKDIEVLARLNARFMLLCGKTDFQSWLNQRFRFINFNHYDYP